jgi:hypothetical protein
MLILAQQQGGNPLALYLLFAFMGLTLLIPFAVWVVTLMDCLNHEPDGSSEKTIWVVVIILFGIFGALAYRFGRRNKRIRMYGR